MKNISSQSAAPPVPEKLHDFIARSAAKPVKIQATCQSAALSTAKFRATSISPSPLFPTRQPREQPDTAGRVVLMGVFAVNTLKFALGWGEGTDGRGRERERASETRDEGRTSGESCRTLVVEEGVTRTETQNSAKRKKERISERERVIEREREKENVGKGVESNAARIGAGTPIRTTSAHYRPLPAVVGSRSRQHYPSSSFSRPLG